MVAIELLGIGEIMSDLWNEALSLAMGRSLLRTSELDIHMIVRRANGDRNHRVIEILLSPDGFIGMGIVRTLDDKGYDQTWLFQHNGKGDEPIWILQGMYQTGDEWPREKTV